MGGQVTRDGSGNCRVNHRLAMSRSIGDFDLKPHGVSAEAQVVRISLKHGKDKFLVLTTGNIFYGLSGDLKNEQYKHLRDRNTRHLIIRPDSRFVFEVNI